MREADKQSSIPAAPKAREGRPFFQFYPADWIASTRGLSGAARGYHIDMLALAWLHGGCDSDTEALRRSVGAERAEWRKVWPELAPRWREVDGRLVNDRQERVRQEAEAYTTSKSIAGKKGGRRSVQARAEAFGSADPRSNREAEREAVVKPSPSPSPSLTTDSKERESVDARAPLPDEKWGALPTRRRKLVMAWEGRREGLGVPADLHVEFLAGMGTADERALLAWYAETEGAWQGRAIGETCWQFWRARFAEWVGVTAKVSRATSAPVIDNAVWAAEVYGVTVEEARAVLAKGGAS